MADNLIYCSGYVELRDNPDYHEDMDYYEAEVMDVELAD